MLIYAPFAYFLLGAGYPVLALWGWFLMVSLASLPDADQKIPFMKHRGFSHTILCGLIIAAVLGGVMLIVGDTVVAGGIRWLAERHSLPASFTDTLRQNTELLLARYGGSALGTFTFGFAFLGILAHLLGDIITPMGIEPFWPLSGSNFSFTLSTAKNPLVNATFFLIGWGVLIAAGVFGSGLLAGVQ